MITLIIVDCQNDFITGTVAVKGAKEVVEEIKNFIKTNKKDIDKIIFTAQWHPYNHCTFKQFGGNLQHHCIQFTPGACIEPKLLKLVQSYNINYEVSTRGTLDEVDQEGAFEEIEFTQDSIGKRYYFDSIAVADADTDFVICGVNNVKETILNLAFERIYLKVFMKGTIIEDKNFLKEIEGYEQDIKKVSKKV